MQDVPSLTLALSAGLLSFLSPCVLPLLPSYLGVLGGQQASRVRALGFVSGFSLVFVALGATASTLGHLLNSQMYWLIPASGILITTFGLMMLGVLRLPFLSYDHRFDLGKASKYGPIALGAAFALGWTPCVGPIYGSILSLAATKGQLLEGITLLLAYSLGLALPFLITALFWQHLNLRSWARHTALLEKIGGGILTLVGLLIATGQFPQLARFFLEILPEGWRNLL